MFGFVGSRIVEHEQRIEPSDTGLRGIAFHLLWLVHDNDRIVSGYHVNRPSASELITFGINYTAFLAPSALFHGGCKSLCIDNHYTQTRI